MKLIEIIGLALGLTELSLLIGLVYMIQKYGQLNTHIKMIAMFAVLLVPIITVVTANYHVFVSSKHAKSCVTCHIMRPMGNDMMDVNSTTLAARHYQNAWIKDDECYSCHKDYGLNGTLKAKADGYRHLLRYMTSSYEEPITMPGGFNSKNCMKCHEGTKAFTGVREHSPVVENMYNGSNTVSCLNCHGQAHPTKSARTPGSDEYDELMEPVFFKKITVKAAEDLHSFLTEEQ